MQLLMITTNNVKNSNITKKNKSSKKIWKKMFINTHNIRDRPNQINKQ